VPERAHAGIETQFRADNQPKKRGRPRASPDKMPRALKLEVAELGRVKNHCHSRPKGFRHADMSRFASAPPSHSRPQADAGTRAVRPPRLADEASMPQPSRSLWMGSSTASKSNRGRKSCSAIEICNDMKRLCCFELQLEIVESSRESRLDGLFIGRFARL
jgi:hypothetical protein